MKKDQFQLTLSFITLLVSCIAYLLLPINASGNYLKTQSFQQPKIVASIFPLYYLAKSVGGNYADVTLLLPPGASPHCWEPRPSDMLLLKDANIILIVGPLEPWANTVLKGSDTRAVIIRAADGEKLIRVAPGPKGIDPHIWMDFKWDQHITRHICDVLCKIAPQHADYYRKQADRTIEKLRTLDKTYKMVLSRCKNKFLIIAGHGAFGYLARAYGLKQIALSGITPDAMPTAVRMAKIIWFIKKHHIKSFFYEETGPILAAKTIASETGAIPYPLTPAASLTRSEIKSKTSFIGLMYKNLSILKKALY